MASSSKEQKTNGSVDVDTTHLNAETNNSELEIQELNVNSNSLDLHNILTAISETAYHWDIKSDQMIWAENSTHVLMQPDMMSLASGSAFNLLIDPDHSATRYDCIALSENQDKGKGVPYRLKYKFLPSGRRKNTSLWLEDVGCWFAGRDGRPAQAKGVIRVINDRHQEEKRLEYLSGHDELTGQMNRFHLSKVISQALEQSKLTSKSCAFLLASVDNLTLINETFGFDIGDEVIAAIGRRFRDCLRQPDTIGRYSSNKFGIVLNDCDNDQMAVAAERILGRTRGSIIETSAGSISVTASIGGVQFPRYAHTVHNICACSLEALDEVKAKRHDSAIFYTPSQQRDSVRRKNIEVIDEVIKALNDQRMLLALQPIVDAKTSKPIFYECLLRMRRLDGSIASAGEFIPVSEKLGLSRLIDHRVLELAVNLMKRMPDMKLSLNISGHTTTDPEWLDSLRARLSCDEGLAKRLIVEITETAVIKDIDESVKFVKTLQDLGCQVAIDDFGAGYSSFRNLKLLGVDMVKIDGAFIKNLKDNPDDRIFVKTLADLAENFNLVSVAEWVGDKVTAKLLCDAGITYLQGFFFGAPELVTFEEDDLAKAGAS